MHRFSPGLLGPHHPLMAAHAAAVASANSGGADGGRPGAVSNGPSPAGGGAGRRGRNTIPHHHKPDIEGRPGSGGDKSQSPSKANKEPHIKKPLNAFMLYMKEMRPVVQAKCTLKESAAINQILGRRVSER